jgi:murein DD-endopeptidase MepM/ murein hydrolase activator NlpD
MAKNRYYYYDEQTFSFVELKPRRSKLVKQGGILFLIALVMASFLTWGIDRVIGTPEELALIHENSVLQQQLSTVRQKMSEFSAQLDALAQSDQELYRTILQADPIHEDLRQVGVGGSDVYEQFDAFSPSTSEILRETAAQLDQLERQMNLQNESYRNLANLAEKRSEWLAQMPAILPADGPVVSGHGQRFHPILRINRMHHGIDILVPRGTPVHAAGDGVILESGRNSGLGNYVKVKHLVTGYTTVYAHLSDIPDTVVRGKAVKRGDKIGYSGNTGLSAAPHLHYEVRGADGRSVNPIYFFLPNMTPEQYREMFAAVEATESSLD